MKITGTLIKNYLHCKREAYLYYYGLNFRNELVKIGEVMHEEQNPNEFVFESLKIDDIQDNDIVEFKKTSSNKEGTKFQVLWYLKYFKDRGLNLKGRIVDLTNNSSKIVVLNENNERELLNLIEEIKSVLKGDLPEKNKRRKNCKGCSFFDYCWSE